MVLKKLFKWISRIFIALIIIGVIGVSIIINSTIVYMILLVVALFIIAIWFLLRTIKKHKQQAEFIKGNIPQALTEIFNQCEEELKKNDGRTPYEILWGITNKDGKYDIQKEVNENGRNETKRDGGTSNVSRYNSSEQQGLQSLGNPTDKKHKVKLKLLD